MNTPLPGDRDYKPDPNYNKTTLPRDIGGYQHVEFGPTENGDMWVQSGVPHSFVDTAEWPCAEVANNTNFLTGTYHIYRKMAQPGHHQPDVVAELVKHGLKPSGSLRVEGNVVHPHVTGKGIYIGGEPLPDDAKARKEIPIATGCVDYFPRAIAAIAHVSFIGNEQHNPGTPLHWDRSKSGDEADAMMRHFVQRGTVDQKDGCRHSAKMAWRALALLEKELENAEKKPLAGHELCG